MSILPIVLWPDRRLTQTCVPVSDLADVQDLATDMLETMYAAPGRGLAAPQVGAMVRLFVMDAGWKEGKSDPLVCINPMFQEIGEDRVTAEEGCLSIPGVTTLIKRPSTVQMQWTGLNGARFVQSFDGFAAACVQHEMDHLDGVVTFDHLDSQARADIEGPYLDTTT